MTTLRLGLVGVLAAALAADAAAVEEVVDFPGGGFRTFQAAIDAVPDGGTLRIAPGRYAVDEPVFVRGKKVYFKGPGRGGGQGARLAARRPDRVVPAADAAGVINFIDAGGGLEGFEIFGGDASVVTRGTSDRSLTVNEMRLAHTGRGILHLAPAHLEVEDSAIQDCLWNGISFAPKNLDHVPFIPKAIVAGTQIIDGAHIGIYVSHASLEVIVASLGGWPGGGIAVEKSSAVVLDSYLVQNGKFGILFLESQGVVLDTTILGTSSASGFLGDGISVWCGGAHLSGLDIKNSERAAVSNFSAHVALGDSGMTCNGIDVAVETLPGGFACSGVPPTFDDDGGVLCGCPNATGNCIAQGVGAPSAPPLLGGLE